jgi:hypothetical protein
VARVSTVEPGEGSDPLEGLRWADRNDPVHYGRHRPGIHHGRHLVGRLCRSGPRLDGAVPPRVPKRTPLFPQERGLAPIFVPGFRSTRSQAAHRPVGLSVKTQEDVDPLVRDGPPVLALLLAAALPLGPYVPPLAGHAAAARFLA